MPGEGPQRRTGRGHSQAGPSADCLRGGTSGPPHPITRRGLLQGLLGGPFVFFHLCQSPLGLVPTFHQGVPGNFLRKGFPAAGSSPMHSFPRTPLLSQVRKLPQGSGSAGNRPHSHFGNRAAGMHVSIPHLDLGSSPLFLDATQRHF